MGGLYYYGIPGWNISIRSILKLVWINLIFKFYRNTLIICCNSKSEHKLCKIFRLKSKVFNQNMHECEFEFKPINQQKIYDAIYFAQAKKI